MRKQIHLYLRTVCFILLCQYSSAFAQTDNRPTPIAQAARLKAIVQAAKAAHSTHLPLLESLKPSPTMTNSGTNIFPAASVADNKLAVTTFVVSGGIGTFPAGYNFNSVSSQSINSEGAITGTYYTKVPITSTSFYAALHGFLRQRNGKLTLFDAPNAIATLNAGTTPEAINDRGDVAGTFQDVNLASHAFFRRRDGALTVIDVPEASATLAVGMNSLGEVVGNLY